MVPKPRPADKFCGRREGDPTLQSAEWRWAHTNLWPQGRLEASGEGGPERGSGGRQVKPLDGDARRGDQPGEGPRGIEVGHLYIACQYGNTVQYEYGAV